MTRAGFVVLAMLVACSASHDDVDRGTSPRLTPPIAAGSGSAAPSNPACGSAGATTPPSPVVQLVAGMLHACARLADGTVWCWGARGHHLIDGDVTGPRPCSIATRVDELAPATKLVGDCALRQDDTMRCGDVERDRFDKPVPIPDAARGLDEEIATQTEVCRRRGATVSCTRDGTEVTLDTHARRIARAERGGWWIVRDDGRLIRRGVCAAGSPGCIDSVEGPPNVVDVSSGKGLECIVDASGVVWCKDERAPNASVARGTPPTFERVDGVHDAKQIAVGERHVCVLAGSEVVCWGSNACGQSGADTMSRERCGSADVSPTTIRWAR